MNKINRRIVFIGLFLLLFIYPLCSVIAEMKPSTEGIWTGTEMLLFDGETGLAYTPSDNTWRYIDVPADSPALNEKEAHRSIFLSRHDEGEIVLAFRNIHRELSLYRFSQGANQLVPFNKAENERRVILPSRILGLICKDSTIYILTQIEKDGGCGGCVDAGNVEVLNVPGNAFGTCAAYGVGDRMLVWYFGNGKNEGFLFDHKGIMMMPEVKMDEKEIDDRGSYAGDADNGSVPSSVEGRPFEGPVPRTGFGHCLFEDKMFVFGGCKTYGTSVGKHYLKTGFYFSINSGKWNSLPLSDILGPTYEPAMCSVGFGVFVYGNEGGCIYDFENEDWIQVNMKKAPIPKRRPVCIFTGEEVIVWGGHDLSNYYGGGSAYNIIDEAWRRLPPLPPKKK